MAENVENLGFKGQCIDILTYGFSVPALKALLFALNKDQLFSIYRKRCVNRWPLGYGTRKSIKRGAFAMVTSVKIPTGHTKNASTFRHIRID